MTTTQTTTTAPTFFVEADMACGVYLVDTLDGFPELAGRDFIDALGDELPDMIMATLTAAELEEVMADYGVRAYAYGPFVKELPVAPLVETDAETEITIDGTTFSTNRARRSKTALAKIIDSVKVIEAAGLKIRLGGGSSGMNAVYIYEAGHVGRNSIKTAIYAFSYRYMKGEWFSGTSAVNEAFANGLAMACERLVLVEVA